MSTRVCGNCGSENQAGSANCANCGEGLGELETVVCPSCHEPNPSDSRRCIECGSDLPESLPDVEGLDIPDWLKSQAADGGLDADTDAGDLPDWLRELESGDDGPDRSDESVKGALPDWLAKIGAEEPDENEALETAGDLEAVEEAGNDLPSWLHSLESGESDRDSPDLDSAEPEPEEGLPPWLRQMTSGEPPGDGEEGTPTGLVVEDFAPDEAEDQRDSGPQDPLTGWDARKDEPDKQPPKSDLFDAVRDELDEALPVSGLLDRLHAFELEEGETADQDDAPDEVLDDSPPEDDYSPEEDAATEDLLAFLGDLAGEAATLELAEADENAVDLAEQWTTTPLDMDTAALLFPLAREEPVEQVDEDIESLIPPAEAEPVIESTSGVEELEVPELRGTAPEVAEPIDEDTGEDAIEDELAGWLREMAPRDTGLLPALEELPEVDEGAGPGLEVTVSGAQPSEVLPEWLADLPDMGVEAPELEVEAEDASGDDFVLDDETELVAPAEPPVIEPEPDMIEPAAADDEVHADAIPDEAPADWLDEIGLDELPGEEASAEWLEEIVPEAVEESEDALFGAAVPADASQELEGVPEQLASTELPDWLQSELGELALDESLTGSTGGDLPDWLNLLDSPGLELALDDLQATLADTEVDQQEGEALEVPLTFDDLAAEEPEEEAAVALGSDEMPAWLQAARPGEEVAEELPYDNAGPVVVTGPLAGLRGVIEIEPVIAEPREALLKAARQPSEEKDRQLAALARLMQDEESDIKHVARARPSPSKVSLRLALGGALLFFVLIGLVLPTLDIELGGVLPPSSEATLAAHQALENAQGRPVLLAFEYTPALAAELDGIADVVLSQLSANDSAVFTVSQNPTGVALAERLVRDLDELSAQSLGYIPGGQIGLRRLGSCLGSNGSCDDLFGRVPSDKTQASLDNLALIILLAGDRDSLVSWMEQIEPGLDVPIVAGLAQPLAPLAAPYLASGQLSGVISGIPAAAAYENELRGEAGIASELVASQLLASWLVVILLAVGAAYYGLVGMVGSGRQRDRA